MTKRDHREKYILYLFVAGASLRSTKAIKDITRICREHLKDMFELTVVDIFQQPELARQDGALPHLRGGQVDRIRRKRLAVEEEDGVLLLARSGGGANRV